MKRGLDLKDDLALFHGCSLRFDLFLLLLIIIPLALFPLLCLFMEFRSPASQPPHTPTHSHKTRSNCFLVHFGGMILETFWVVVDNTHLFCF